MNLTPENDRDQQKVIPLFKSGDYYYRRGVEAYRKKDLHRAVKLFKRAIKLIDTEPFFHVQLASVLSELGEYERSNDILHKVLVEEGDSIGECYFFIANNYAYLGFFEKAERAALRYLDLQPNERFTDDARDLLELLRHEREQDEDSWEELDLKEDELIVRHERARYLLRKNDIQSAIPILEEVIIDHPTCWAAMNHLAEAYFRMGDDKAFEVCDKILDQDHGNLFAICNLALFYTKKGEASKAEPFIQSLKKVYPLDWDHYIIVAETLCTVGEYHAAYCRLRELEDEDLEFRPALLFCTGVALVHLDEQVKALPYIVRGAKLNDTQAVEYLKQSNGETKNKNIFYNIWVE